MVDLESVVWIVLYCLCAAAVFGLLFFLIGYLEKQFPGGEGGGLFYKLARVVLVVLAVLVIIGIIISLLTGRAIFTWGHDRPLFIRGQ